MRFLIDAQLPKRFCSWIVSYGHEAKHTLDLPLRNRTLDDELIGIAEREDSVVVTKDDDFVQSFLVSGRPQKLLLVATGNISNSELEKIMAANIKAIINAFEKHRFIEIGLNVLVIHE